MAFERNKFYTFLLLLCVAGYGWLFYALMADPLEHASVEVCLFKHITNIPCPSCGSTRALLLLIHGEVWKSLAMNPLGVIIAGMLSVTPLWILFDLAAGKQTLPVFYKRMEVFLVKPGIAAPLIVLVLINWIWNIVKGL
jgi:hypothetical protein